MSIQNRYLWSLTIVPLAALMIGTAVAQDSSSAPTGNESPALVENFDELITGLDSEEFADRQAASQKLTEQGVKALPALEQGATGESREASQRSLELIKKLFESSDAETKKQAEASLKRLSEGSNAAIASRAKSILEPPPQPMNDPNRGIFQAVPIQGGAIQIQVQQQFGGGGKRVTTRNVNGVREIEVQEGDRKVKIHDDPNKGIEIEITEKKDGKDETKKYEAKNAEELKKNHPEAYKAFEDFGKAGVPGNIQIQAIGPVIRPAIAPAMDPAEMRKRRLESTNRALEGIQKAMDQLEQQKKRVLEQKAQLEKEAEKPSEVKEEPASERPAAK